MGIPFFLKKTKYQFENVGSVPFYVCPGAPGENWLLAAEQSRLDEITNQYEPVFVAVSRVAQEIAATVGLTHIHAFATITDTAATKASDDVFDWLDSRNDTPISAEVLSDAGFDDAEVLFKALQEYGFCRLDKNDTWRVKLPVGFEPQKYKSTEIRVRFSNHFMELNRQIETEQRAKKLAVVTMGIRHRGWQAMDEQLATATPEEAKELKEAIAKIKNWDDADTALMPYSYINEVYEFLERQRSGGVIEKATADNLPTEEDLKKAFANAEQSNGKKSTGDVENTGKRKKDLAPTSSEASQSG